MFVCNWNALSHEDKMGSLFISITIVIKFHFGFQTLIRTKYFVRNRHNATKGGLVKNLSAGTNGHYILQQDRFPKLFCVRGKT